MMSDKGQKLTTAGPSVPVEITGLGEVPEAGAHFNAVADERLARELVEQRKEEEKRNGPNRPTTRTVRSASDGPFVRRPTTYDDGDGVRKSKKRKPTNNYYLRLRNGTGDVP